MRMSPDFKEFFELLNERNVEYLVVGGYAVAFYGYPRYTGDIDIWIAASHINVEKVIYTLGEFGFASLNISIEDLAAEDVVIQLGYPPNRIDIMTSVTGLTFEESYKLSVTTTIDGVNVRFIDAQSLKKNKLATNRHRDLDDLENLP
ncbi:MAG: nucleotidyltransferase [Bacteriodetes bacterium]|nr:nucleotidyltransferase [Bacteroidota bacterium]